MKHQPKPRGHLPKHLCNLSKHAGDPPRGRSEGALALLTLVQVEGAATAQARSHNTLDTSQNILETPGNTFAISQITLETFPREVLGQRAALIEQIVALKERVQPRGVQGSA